MPAAAVASTEVAWVVSVALRAGLALLTRWRALRWYLLASVTGTLLLMAAPLRWYRDLWIAKGLLLCAGNVLLVREASRRLTGPGYAACGLATALAGAALAAAPRWPGLWLEVAFTGFGLCSLFLGCQVALGWRDFRGMVLAGYLLLDAMTILSASAHIERIGVAVGVATSCCYVAWGVGEVSERRRRRMAVASDYFG